jgi:DNA processing protein
LKFEIEQTKPGDIVAQLIERGALSSDKSSRWHELLTDGRERWKARLSLSSVVSATNTLRYLQGRFLTSRSELWPQQLNDLSSSGFSHAPHALWVRGQASALPMTSRSLAVVGSRASTSYGEFVTADLIAAPVSRNYSIVSGGAFGIDTLAHRATLALGGVTFSIMAGGIDRFYPSGNSQLFAEVMKTGAVISEVAPDSAPTKWRFLQRNRLIAAMSNAVLLVEAGYRSGAHNTAKHAMDLNRPIGAVPGPITSPASAGCHRLIHDHTAELISDSTDLFDLLGEPIEWQNAAQLSGLGPLEVRTLDAIGFGTAELEHICTTAGLTKKEARIALSSLELDKLVVRTNRGWARSQTTV